MATEPAELKDSQKVKVPPKVQDRIERSIARMKEGEGDRNVCMKFWRSEQYYWTNSKGALNSQPTVTDFEGRSGKRPHRQRRVRNMIFDVVEREVSQATSRVPSYEVSASTNEPEDIDAAALSEKVAQYGYVQWNMRKAVEDVVRYAVLCQGGGFAWPYFDNSIGPFVQTEDGRIGMGDIRIRTFGPNEVAWEPGLSFEESPYHVIKQARVPDEVYAMEGYVGGALAADADAAEAGDDKRGAKLVMVTDYLERPCPEYPQGRWFTTANERVIVEERAYPCALDDGGEPIDEPILHNLSYARDPDSDRDQGLVQHLLDPQRDVNLMVSKQDEWVILALNPQVIIQNGGLTKGQRLTDEPGAVYNAWGNGKIDWRPVPPIPPELGAIKQQAESDIDKISGRSVTDATQLESGREAEALGTADEGRRYTFFQNLADFHAGLMRHCLYLVQKHFTDERLLEVNGRFGADPIAGFRGAKLRGQMDVRVSADSLFPRSRKMLQDRIMQYAQMGWIGPEAAMDAINTGTAEVLIDGYELDKKRAYSVIRSIRDGSFISQPPRPVFPNEDAGPKLDEMGNPIQATDANGMPLTQPGPPDPLTGLPGPPEPVYVQATEVPGWLPRPGVDNLSVHKTIFSDFFKTVEFERFADDQKESTMLYYTALLDLEMREAQRAAELQQQRAEEQGMFNAGKVQQASPMPSLPALNGGGGNG